MCEQAHRVVAMVCNGNFPMFSPVVFLALLVRVAGDDMASLMLTSPPPVPIALPLVDRMPVNLPTSLQQVAAETGVSPAGVVEPNSLGLQSSAPGISQQDDNSQHYPVLDSRDPVSTFVFSDLPMALGYLTGLALAIAALWACCRCCRGSSVKASSGELGKGRSALVRRGDYEQVSASERDGLLQTSPTVGDGDGSSSGDDDSGMHGASPILAPLRELGMALKDNFTQRDFNFGGVAGRLLSTSAGAGGSRPSNSQDRGRRDAYRGDHDSGDEEEACGLLQDERDGHEEEDREPLLACNRVKSPPRLQTQQSSRSPLARSHVQVDEDDEEDEDEAAVSALLKLRPAARDSVGGDLDDDDLATGPLVGSERASFLSR